MHKNLPRKKQAKYTPHAWIHKLNTRKGYKQLEMNWSRTRDFDFQEGRNEGSIHDSTIVTLSTRKLEGSQANTKQPNYNDHFNFGLRRKKQVHETSLGVGKHVMDPTYILTNSQGFLPWWKTKKNQFVTIFYILNVKFQQ